MSMTEEAWIGIAAVAIIVVGGIWWSRRAKAQGVSAGAGAGTERKAGGDVHQTDTKP